MDARRISAVAVVGVLLGLVVVALTLLESGEDDSADTPPILLVDDPTFDAARYRSKTFSLAVADINGDSRDDILIGAHNQNPFLLINTGSGFADQSRALFPRPRRNDRHGYTVADFDNDGRLDIAIAGGGADGVGEGWPNLLLRNVTEGEQLHFVEQAAGEAFALRPGRARALIPITSRDGRAVDLYYATLQRDGYDNRLFRNNGGTGDRPFLAVTDYFLSRKINDQGRGVMADLDGDGGRDYVVVESDRLNIYWHRDSGSTPTKLTGAARTALLADFNNDGLLDVFVGRTNRESLSDRMTFASDAMIFTLHKNMENDSSEFTFRAKAHSLEFNLNQWVPASQAQRLDNTAHIFLGQEGSHPEERIFITDRSGASGYPRNMSEPGIYIWYLPIDDAWHVRCIFPPGLKVFKGGASASGLEELARENFHVAPISTVADEFFINTGEGRFAKLALEKFAHPGVTQGATVADFNGDGWLDVLGVRHGEQGDSNLAPFLLTNLGLQQSGGVAFTETLLPQRRRDRLHRADQVVHGFFNEDDLPDAFLTNGYGQVPGTNGVPRLLLNASNDAGASLLVSLRGTTANRFGIGAEVALYRGDRLLGFRVAGLNINTSQDTSWLQFGLGETEGPYRLVVDWPDGRRSEHELAGAGRIEVWQPA